MADVLVENHGSVFLLRPLTDLATSWMGENVHDENAQYMGEALAVEPRYVGALVEGMLKDGLIVC